ncbi:cytosolic iron-sulfur protein assembly [Physocladia obscura]|uniref:Probable cytosolic iron-sulfur protein assembly protein 1 n=1 Tax=Physocladia obscura TaxID=109957 RepID=A0AAD5X920_9FUNG|nr:cytosolic iron-sulfur protein assembly [Physocladia obscura]
MSVQAVLSGHTERVWQAAWHPTRLEIASGGGDRAVRVWRQGRDGQWACVWHEAAAHKRTVRAVAWGSTADGAVLTTAGFDGATAVWEADGDDASLACVATLEGHENEVKAVAWAAGGTLVATCARDKSVWVWESLDDGDFECVAVLHEHTQDVKGLAWHPARDDVLVSASYDDSIKVWRDRAGDWYCADTLANAHASTVWAVDFDPSGNLLASVGDDCALNVWRTDNIDDAFVPFRKVASLQNAHSRPIYSVAWSKAHGLIATAGGDNAIRIFKFDHPSNSVALVTEIINAHGDFDVNCVRWCPLQESSHLLLSCGDDANIRIWSFDSQINNIK